MPKEFSGREKDEMAHLSEWMGYSLNHHYGIPVHSSRDDVKVLLTEEEVVNARNYLKEISPNKPVVALPLFSTTKNRNLPRKTIEEIVLGISSFATPLFLPTAIIKEISKAIYLSDDLPLRETAAIFYASDSVVGVDTGPTHLANAVLQGTPDYEIEGINTNKNKVLWLLGATHPEVTIYSGNRFISHTTAMDVCPLQRAWSFSLLHI